VDASAYGMPISVLKQVSALKQISLGPYQVRSGSLAQMYLIKHYCPHQAFLVG
jgi:hypothetical protein